MSDFPTSDPYVRFPNLGPTRQFSPSPYQLPPAGCIGTREIHAGRGRGAGEAAALGLRAGEPSSTPGGDAGEPACRMDLPGPTASVGTRTDYSVGPWDYLTCAARYLMV
jgi:hypothetical protein